jgi:Glycoside hydrolase 123 N-terminal domain
MNKKIIAGLCGMTLMSTVLCAQESVYQQLNFKQLNPKSFSVYSTSAPKGWQEVVIKDQHTKATANKEEQQQGFIVYQRPATEPIYPKSFPAPNEKIDSLTAFSSLGEIEPLTFSIYALKELKDLQVNISALKSGTDKIKTADIEQRVVTYWTTRYPRYTTEGRYIYTPELLMPIASLSFPKSFSFRYWFIIHTPKNAKPGLYKGTVTLKIAGETATTIPVNYRVLNIKLLKDPNKHFTAYAYNKTSTFERAKFAQGFVKDPKRYRAIRLNEYKKMKEYGFDMYPSIYPGFNSRTDEITLDVDELKLMQQAGLKGPAFVYLGGVFSSLHRKFFKQSAGSHCKTLQVNKKFLQTLKQMVAKLEQVRKKQGFPVFIYGLLDEVTPSKAKTAAAIYAKIKELNVPTQTTKDFNAGDSTAYHKYVDYWCSPGYSVSYETAVSSKKHHFWCYPNDIAGQFKDALIMGKGGRFTYGLGAWRSGFTTLIPWHWRWQVGEAFDYCRGARGGTGNRIDPQGLFLPTYYWENFREGYDDGRYIYTLQQLISERSNSKNSQCQRVVKTATAYLQTLWNYIPNHEKYIDGNNWLGKRFNLMRWRIAQNILALQKYPATKKITAPSVIINPSLKQPVKSEQTAYTTFNLQDVGKWRNITNEGKLTLSDKVRYDGHKVIKWQVTIDKKRDGGGETTGKYPVGWPRIYRAFKPGTLDLNSYELFSVWIYVDSDRDAVQAEQAPLHYDFIFNNPGGKSIKINGYLLKTISERKWTKIQLNLKNILGAQQVDLKNFKAMQIWIGESQYPDKATIKFYFADMALLRLNNPLIHDLYYLPEDVIGAKQYLVKYNLFGITTVKPGAYTITAKLVNDNNKTVAKASGDVTAGNSLLLPTAKITIPGEYKLFLSISNSYGKIVNQQVKTVNFMLGIKK